MLGIVAGLFDYNWDEAAHQFRLAMNCVPVPVEGPAVVRVFLPNFSRPIRGRGKTTGACKARRSP